MICLEKAFGVCRKFLGLGYGAIAQLGERLPCKQEVSGSIPLGSTINNISSITYRLNGECGFDKIVFRR